MPCDYKYQGDVEVQRCLILECCDTHNPSTIMSAVAVIPNLRHVGQVDPAPYVRRLNQLIYRAKLYDNLNETLANL
jgi:hypothetical protein